MAKLDFLSRKALHDALGSYLGLSSLTSEKRPFGACAVIPLTISHPISFYAEEFVIRTIKRRTAIHNIQMLLH